MAAGVSDLGEMETGVFDATTWTHRGGYGGIYVTRNGASGEVKEVETRRTDDPYLDPVGWSTDRRTVAIGPPPQGCVSICGAGVGGWRYTRLG